MILGNTNELLKKKNKYLSLKKQLLNDYIKSLSDLMNKPFIMFNHKLSKAND